MVLERGRVGQTWRDLWDSFCLVTPNWSVRLPGNHYAGDDPDGFMPRDEMVEFLERYAAGFDAPVREGVGVTASRPRAGDGLLLHTSGGDLRARPSSSRPVPFSARTGPAGGRPARDLPQIGVEDYRNEQALPPGRVLIVGSGQSGCQIAEELHEAGREVFLACGDAPWAPRRFGGHDLVWWLDETGFLDSGVESLPTPAARLAATSSSPDTAAATT